MNTIDPNDAARAWTRRRDAAVDGVRDGAGHLYRYVLAVEDEAFWAIVARHAR